MRFLRLKIEKRAEPSFFMRVAFPFVAVLMGLGIGAILIVMVGANPLFAYQKLFYGAFGNIHYISETLVKTAPLLLAGLGVGLAFKCKIWNIGAEGQLYFGALVATGLGLLFAGSSSSFILLLVIIASFVGGALWAFIPAFFKAKLGANEILTTLMMNYIIIFFVSYLLHNPWKDPVTLWPESAPISLGAHLPVLIPGTRLHAGILIALLCVFLMYVLLQRTTLGYKIKTVGANPRAAEFAGISVAKSIIIVMLISGGLAGLAGMGEVCGVQHRLRTDLSPGYGYTAILIAMMGKLHPIGIALSALFFGAVMNGASLMYRATGIPVALVYTFEGILFLCVIGCELLVWYRIRRETK